MHPNFAPFVLKWPKRDSRDEAFSELWDHLYKSAERIYEGRVFRSMEDAEKAASTSPLAEFNCAIIIEA